MDEERLRFEIATKVMGLEVYQATAIGYEQLFNFDDYNPKYELYYDDGLLHYVPMFPYNMSECWQAVEKIVNTPQSIDFRPGFEFVEWFEKVQIWTLPEQKAATLICRAILTIYGLQNEKETDDYAIENYS